MIAIIDYGVGNLFSLTSSFAAIGAEAVITSAPDVIHAADRIVLPGVGAFGDAVQKLKDSSLFHLVKDEAQSGKPMLGICLGMQLLFEKSFEYGEHEGLGLIPGAVRPLRPLLDESLKVPHMGWNKLQYPGEKDELFKHVDEDAYVYFVHSYAAMDCQESVTAWAEYGIPVTAAVRRGNVFGTQFHPEKSGRVGLNILRAFAEYRRDGT